MREACQIAANVLRELCDLVEPGICTLDIDQEARKRIQGYGAESACFNYRNGALVFPSHTCLSVNDEIVHGIGTLDKTLKPGDNLSIDVVVRYRGFIGDNARTVAIGDISADMLFLIESTEQALIEGIAKARAGKRVGDISHAIQRFLEQRQLGIVREFVGHGVGRSMHEDPQIPNFGRKGSGDKLRPGMTLAIEPMVTLGSPEIRMGADGWTALTADGSPAAHFEHTVLVTHEAAEILTLFKN